MTQDAAPKHYPPAGIPERGLLTKAQAREMYPFAERSNDLMFRAMIAMGVVQAACWITVIVLVLT